MSQELNYIFLNANLQRIHFTETEKHIDEVHEKGTAEVHHWESHFSLHEEYYTLHNLHVCMFNKI